MIRDIVKDPMFLSVKSEVASEKDLSIAQDLADTLRAHRAHCVGMAANMIGFHKRIIIVDTGFLPLIMINPVIMTKEKSYQTKEGCLSLSGERNTVRYEKISVKYLDLQMKERTGVFTDRIAEIIQHECDHLEGILI